MRSTRVLGPHPRFTPKAPGANRSSKPHKPSTTTDLRCFHVRVTACLNEDMPISEKEAACQAQCRHRPGKKVAKTGFGGMVVVAGPSSPPHRGDAAATQPSPIAKLPVLHHRRDRVERFDSVAFFAQPVFRLAPGPTPRIGFPHRALALLFMAQKPFRPSPRASGQPSCVLSVG